MLLKRVGSFGKKSSSKTAARERDDLEARLARSERASVSAASELAAVREELRAARAALAEAAGAPAAREHAKRGRELDAARAQLAALRAADGHAHELVTDDAAAARRQAEAAEFRLRQVDEVAAARAADNKRLISDLHKGQAELAAERKQRFQYEDRLKVLEARQAEKDASKENAARAAASPVRKQLRSTAEAFEAAKADRDEARRAAADDRDALVAVAQARDEATQKLELVRAALAATAAVAPLAGGEKGDGEDGGEGGAAPVDGWNHHLVVERVQALCEERRELVARSETWKEHELAKAFSERGTREATERAEKAEAELAATKAALAAAEAAAEEGQRYKEFPVGTAEADLREAEAALADVRNGEVPLLRAQLEGTQEALHRAERVVRTEREAKATAAARALVLDEQLKTTSEAAMLADKRAAIAEAAAAAARREADDEKRLRAAQAAEAEKGKELGEEYARKVSAVEAEASTSAMRHSLLEEQARHLQASLSQEEEKVRGRDEMLRALQVEFGRTRERLNTAETECLAAQHAAQRAESGRRDAEAERDETNEKLQLCMLEVRARTERADYLNAQLAAARAEMRALDNQLVIHSNQLALTKQSNSQLADGATAKASELGAAQTALHAKEERLDATQLALAGARAESAKLSEEAARLRASLAEALEGKRLKEQQLAHMQTTVAFAKQEQATAKRNEEAAAALAEDERLMRARHEGSIAPLRAALKEKVEALKEAEDEQLGAQLLAERLAVADAQHVADEEASELAGRKVAAAEARAANAEGRLAGLSTELGRRDARVAAIKHSLSAANEELALLRASKQLLAARHELGAELAKQRDATASEGEALQAAIAASFSRHREAAAVGAAIETIGSADGDGGAAAAIATAGAAAAARGSASAREAAIEAAQAELVALEEAKAATVREQQRAAAELEATTRELHATGGAAAAEEARKAESHFHSIVLLVKMLLNHRRNPENVLAAELYDEVVAKRVAVEEWPQYVHLRMSGGEPLSASAADNDW